MTYMSRSDPSTSHKYGTAFAEGLMLMTANVF